RKIRRARTALGGIGWGSGSGYVTNIRGGVDIVVVVSEVDAKVRLGIHGGGEAVIAVVLAMQGLGYVVAALQHIHGSGQIEPWMRLVADSRFVMLQVAR